MATSTTSNRGIRRVVKQERGLDIGASLKDFRTKGEGDDVAAGRRERNEVEGREKKGPERIPYTHSITV